MLALMYRLSGHHQWEMRQGQQLDRYLHDSENKKIENEK
jgi:hypothetical protein